MNGFLKRLVLFTAYILLFFFAPAQSSRVPLDDMVKAIKTNKLQDMDKYLDNFVTITINNAQSVYSHNQAQVILHDFFEKNDARDLSVADSGTPSSNSSFVIGNYTGPDGVKYLVYVLMKAKNNKYTVQEIRLSKE
jgi:Domain of unknown function (DUF4783)